MEIQIKTLIWTYRSIQKSQPGMIKGEHEIRIRLTQLKDVKYISLGYSSSVENWDSENDLPLSSHPKYKPIVKKLNQYLDDIGFEMKLIDRAGRIPTPTEIKEKITNKHNSITAPRTPEKILAYFDKIIQGLEESGNIGYANVFINCKATVNKLLNEKDKSFLSFTKTDHEAYEKQISTDTTESTISHYLRTLYRVWNLAIEDGLCPKEQHPSKYIKFKAYKKIRTKKRSIKSDYLQKVFEKEYPSESRIYRSQKYAQFLYYARGMNFNDMCKLKREVVLNKGINYNRSKNRRSYNFELHPKALAVIDIFMDYPMQSDAGYVFPIFQSIHNTPKKLDQRIDSALKDLNEDLETMAKSAGWQRKFTSYSLRHGFASHLRDKGVAIPIIKEALGHETEEQTQVYLDDIDDAPVADAIKNALL